MKGTTIAIIAIVLIVLVIFGGSYINFNGPSLSVFKGRIKVNLMQVKRIDGTSYAIADSAWRMIHGTKDYNDKVGEITSNAVTGEMKETDAGTWYLMLDYPNTTAWLDISETSGSAYVKGITGFDGDRDGFDEECIELYFGDLGPLAAGEDKKEVDLTLVVDPARTATITYTSLTNSTGIGTSAYTYETATGYMGGFSEGDLAKLARIDLDFSNTGNSTYPDAEYWKLTHFKIGAYTFTSTQFGSYDLANKRYSLKFGDQVNSQGGRDFFDPKNGGDLWASFELKAYCKFPNASKKIVPIIKMYFYKPDGTLTAAFNREVSFTS